MSRPNFFSNKKNFFLLLQIISLHALGSYNIAEWELPSGTPVCTEVG